MSVFPNFLLSNSCLATRRWCLQIIALAAIVLLTAGFGIQASAQSGRRSTAQPAPSPLEPTQLLTAETSSPPATGKPQNKIKLLFARQVTSKHFLNEDVIAASFFNRLIEYLNFDCISIGDLKQAQALARAKSENEAFVVLLKFDINSYQSGTIILNSPDFEIEYFAFAPRTGKKHVKGKMYFQTIGGGRMQKSGWPNGTPIRITPEAAGIEAAETLYHLLAIKTDLRTRR